MSEKEKMKEPVLQAGEELSEEQKQELLEQFHLKNRL